jgi:nucleotide-binding universal stress UspA family protein
MKVLVAYDGSSSAEAAIEDLRTAGLPQTGKALVVSVGNSGAASSGALGRFDECRALAENAHQRIQSYLPGWTVWSEGLRGQASEVLLDVCGWWHPDLLVLGSHGRSRAGRFLMGSVSLDLVHQAPCSVRVVRDGRRSIGDEPLRILIGHDGSTEADALIRSVACRSWPADTEVHVISVVQTLTPASVATLEFNTCVQEPAYTVVREVDEREHKRLTAVAEGAVHRLRGAGLKSHCSVVEGDPQDIILAEADLSNANTIFVGARGTGSLQRLLLGSISTHVVTHAHCTVELVRNSPA